MLKIFSVIILIVAMVLFPPATLALVTQDAIPGDPRYPYKRLLEEGIITIASLHPQTKAWFSLDRSGRRFKEATTLIANGKQADVTLQELIVQTKEAVKEAEKIEDPIKKREYLEQLKLKVLSYEAELRSIRNEITQTQGLKDSTLKPLIEPTPSSTPSPTTTPQAVLNPTSQPTAAASGRSINTPISTTSPSLHPTPTPHPTSTPETGGGTSVDDLDQAIDDLDGIIGNLDHKADNTSSSPQATSSPSPTIRATSTPTPRPTATPAASNSHKSESDKKSDSAKKDKE